MIRIFTRGQVHGTGYFTLSIQNGGLVMKQLAAWPHFAIRFPYRVQLLLLNVLDKMRVSVFREIGQSRHLSSTA